MSESEIKSLMQDADYNGDGKLDYHEVGKQGVIISNHKRILDSCQLLLRFVVLLL